jgi:hypothetical protein
LQQLFSPEVAMPVAAALLGNQGNAANFGNAFAAYGQTKAQTAAKNKTMDFFRQNSPEFAAMVDAGMPMDEAWKTYTQQKYAKAPQGTSDMQEYEAAKAQGFQGTLMDFMVKMKEAGRQQVNIDTGTKLPSGYMWKDPSNQNLGVIPIPGGPATQLPAETAGRTGLADSFLGNFDTIRQKVASGAVTGPYDRFSATNNSSSEAGQIYQAIQTGVDSLQRMLTGAGMPASEASQYAYRYLPGYTDTAESAAAKLDRLKLELQSVKERVMQGRGGYSPEVPASGNKTSTGVTWSVGP